jgi:hypothetical protein
MVKIALAAQAGDVARPRRSGVGADFADDVTVVVVDWV